MTGKRKAARVSFCAMCVALTPANALAGSPEFAYTAEKWAQLRDNRLELGETGDLVREYNNTAIQNQIEYEEYRGESRDDTSQDYYDAAGDMYGTMDYPDSSDSDYANCLPSHLNSQIQADKLREQGDDNVDDGDIKKLGYDQTEAGLVKQVQSSTIDYWSQTYVLKRLEESRFQSQLAYESTAAKLSAGMSTQADLLSAKEAVTTAEASIVSANSSLGKTKEILCLMLGWTYGADMETCDVPEPDLEWMESTSLEPDTLLALENSYSLKILKRQTENAVSVSNRESLEQSRKSQGEVASSSVKNAYQNLLLAREDYAQALQTYELEKNIMDTADRKFWAGTMVRNAYEKQKSSFIISEIDVQIQKLELLRAQLDYQWAVNGFAFVS